jgi:hypothetical protein
MDDKPLDKALDHLAVTPPDPEAETTDDTAERKTTHVRDAHDAEHDEALAQDPTHEDGKLDVGLDESFPSSDPPASTQPGNGEPAPSSGYDEEAERALQDER